MVVEVKDADEELCEELDITLLDEALELWELLEVIDRVWLVLLETKAPAW